MAIFGGMKAVWKGTGKR